MGVLFILIVVGIFVYLIASGASLLVILGYVAAVALFLWWLTAPVRKLKPSREEAEAVVSGPWRPARPIYSGWTCPDCGWTTPHSLGYFTEHEWRQDVDGHLRVCPARGGRGLASGSKWRCQACGAESAGTFDSIMMAQADQLQNHKCPQD